MKNIKMAITYVVIGGLSMLGGCIARDAYEASKDPYERAKFKRKFKNFKNRFSKNRG